MHDFRNRRDAQGWKIGKLIPITVKKQLKYYSIIFTWTEIPRGVS